MGNVLKLRHEGSQAISQFGVVLLYPAGCRLVAPHPEEPDLRGDWLMNQGQAIVSHRNKRYEPLQPGEGAKSG